MTRIPILVVAAMCSALACSDNPAAPIADNQPGTQPPPPSLATIAGRVIVSGWEDDRAVDIKTATGELVRMVGYEARALASVDGGDVLVRGTWDANPGLVVQDFQVTAMKGRPAFDGVLQLTNDGCALRLTDGTLRLVPGDHERYHGSIREYLGMRLWVIVLADDATVDFGVIAPM